MSTWVRNLCTVCGMKPDEAAEPDSPEPPVREVLPHRPAQTLQPQSSLPASAVGIMTKPPNNMTLSARSSPSSRSQGAQHINQRPKQAVPDRDSEYIPLETCTSGSSVRRTNRQISVDSVPEDFAPPPPIIPEKGGGNDFDNDVFHHDQTYDVPPSSEPHEVYDVPPSSSLLEDDLYKVPPPRPPAHDLQETYDIPPPSKHSPSTPRSSSSDSQKADSAYSSQGLMYDIPPSRLDGFVADDVYDIPPSHPQSFSINDVPPSRPPKPGHLQNLAQEPYMNLPTNSRAYSDQSNHVDINSVVTPATAGMAKIDLTEMYDFPKSRLQDNQGNYNNLEPSDKLLTQTPPPPSMCVPREHRYINATESVAEQDVYLPMDPVSGIAEPSHKPRESSSTDNDVEYTDMTGHSSFDDSFEGKQQQIYDHPPPSRPAIPPPRPLRPSSTERQDTYLINSNARTRSFKRKNGSPLVQRKSPPSKPKSNLTKPTVPLPQKVDNRHPDFSTSDEEDEEMGSPDVWGTTPPAPGNKDTELKYVDLDHDDTADHEPMRSPQGAPGGLTPTEYHEIDFLKTDALRNVRETVSVERKKEKSHT